MTQATTMLETYPADLGDVDRHALARAIEECFSCSQACTACADACLSESDVAMLVKCIRENLDCADICDTTGRVLSRHTGYDANVTRACSRRAWPLVSPAATSASATPRSTSIAGSAPRRAAGARKRAGNSWSHSAERRLVCGAASIAGAREAAPRCRRAR